MTTHRAFSITFSFAAFLEVLNWFLPWATQIASIIFFAGYLLLVVLGYLLASAGRGYGLALSLTPPFALLWLGVGMLNFSLGRGENPPDWTPDKETQAL